MDDLVIGVLVGVVFVLAGGMVGLLILHARQPVKADALPEIRDGLPDLATTILEALPDSVLVVNRSGVIVHANRKASNTFALPYLEGLPVEQLIPEELRDQHRRHVQEYFKSPKDRPMGIGLPLQGVRGGGQRFPVDISLAPIQRGGGHAIAVIRDMTARQAAEKGHP